MQNRTDRLREYFDAMTRVILQVEELEEPDSDDELEFLQGTLVELLELHNDVCKPKLDARRVVRRAASPNRISEVDVPMKGPGEVGPVRGGKR